MKRLMLVVIPALLMTACTQTGDEKMTSKTDTSQPRQAESGTSRSYTADNSGVNKGENNLTAEQQSNNANDVQLTADVRRTILEQKNLSVDAQNIKVLAKDGHVTLKGPVATATEKEKLANAVKSVAGVTMVHDEMMVKDKSVASEKGKETR